MPAVTGGDAGACCLRCGQPLEKPWPVRQIDEALGLDLCDEPPPAADAQTTSEPPLDTTAPPERTAVPVEPLASLEAPPLTAWDLDKKLREAERLLGFGATTPARHASGEKAPRPPLDHVRRDAPHVPRAARPRKRTTAPAAPPTDTARRMVLTWTAICLGLMTFACGGSLLVCAYLQARADLWDLGVPMTLAGQVGLLLGLGLQLERLWLENRHTADKLEHVDQQLEDLQQTAHLLGGPYYSASESFYQHLSAGASPQTLLVDLKSQLDLLATHLGRTEDRR